jgi:hypothetical protein
LSRAPTDGDVGDDRPDEDVVHGQVLLDHLSGDVPLTRSGAVGRPDPGAGGHTDRHPDRRLQHAGDVRLAVEGLSDAPGARELERGGCAAW